jgi:hypothetical protein
MNMSKIVIGNKKTVSTRTLELKDAALRLPSTKNFIPLPELLGSLPKGSARKLRKALHRNGFIGLAASNRIETDNDQKNRVLKAIGPAFVRKAA